MKYWLFMFVMTLLIPAAMTVFGRKFMNNPPIKINHLFGYRTTRSMKNEQTWIFAQKLCGKMCYKFGIYALAPSILAMLFVIGRGEEVISSVGIIVTMVQGFAMIFIMILVERELRKNYDKDGNKI